MVELAQAVTETTARWEGIFHLEEIKAFRFDPSWPPEEVYRFVTLQIRRQPDEPLFHAYRLLLALNQGWDHHLYGILVDTICGLGRHGRGLQKLLVHLAAPRLSPSQRTLFEEYFSGLVEELPWGAFSVLHPGTLGRRKGEPIWPEGGAREEHDPLLVARLTLEAGQLEEAIEILEEALKRDPQREDLRKELAELRRELDKQAFAERRRK